MTSAEKLSDQAHELGYLGAVEMIGDLRRWGWTYQRIASMCGVSPSAVWYLRPPPRGLLSSLQLQAMAHHIKGMTV